MKKLGLLLEELPSEREAKIASNPELAYKYAMAIKGRFPAGEKAIATSAVYSYVYAKNVIKGRWPEGEKAIATSSYYSQGYAAMIKKRFKLGEPAILASSDTSINAYWHNYVKGFWPEGWAVLRQASGHIELGWKSIYRTEIAKYEKDHR